MPVTASRTSRVIARMRGSGDCTSFRRACQVANLASQLTGQGIQIRTCGRGAALFGSARTELLDLTLEVAHPVLERVALATRGCRICLGVGQLGAQPRKLLGMLAELLSQRVDGRAFLGQDLAEPFGLGLSLGGARLLARQQAFQAGDSAAQGGDVLVRVCAAAALWRSRSISSRSAAGLSGGGHCHRAHHPASRAAWSDEHTATRRSRSQGKAARYSSKRSLDTTGAPWWSAMRMTH